METKIIKSAKNLYSVGNLTVASLVVLFFFFLSSSSHRYSLFSGCTSISAPKLVEEMSVRDELDAALEAASVENNKTVIMAVVNKAYTESDGRDPVNMLDLFLESFWVGEGTRPLINNLLIVATDRTAYERCLFRGLHCYLLAGDRTDGSDLGKENVFMSKGFIKMMWRRTFFLLTVLRKGYSFIFTDTDVMWLRNPFTILNNNKVAGDIQLSTDWFNGNSTSERNHFNTGFYYVRSTKGTIALFERWYAAKENATGIKEQDVLRKLVSGGALGELNATASFLDTRYFSGFCTDSKELEKVVTVHANCCLYIRAKVRDLARVLEEWKRFKLGLPTNGSSTSAWSSHVNCIASLRGGNGNKVTGGGKVKRRGRKKVTKVAS